MDNSTSSSNRNSRTFSVPSSHLNDGAIDWSSTPSGTRHRNNHASILSSEQTRFQSSSKRAPIKSSSFESEHGSIPSHFLETPPQQQEHVLDDQRDPDGDEDQHWIHDLNDFNPTRKGRTRTRSPPPSFLHHHHRRHLLRDSSEFPDTSSLLISPIVDDVPSSDSPDQHRNFLFRDGDENDESVESSSDVASIVEAPSDELNEGREDHGGSGETSIQDEQEDEVEEAEEESEEMRRLREEEESEALARQLMAEEAMASYHQSSNFLRDHASDYNEEDLAALQAAMAEEAGLGGEEEEDEETEDSADLSYDALLRLGEQIGDVKSERWALKARAEIDKLPVTVFRKEMAIGKDENDCHAKCLICQFPYEDEEKIRTLPCGHCFHDECVDQWLSNKDFCPYCRQCIVVE